MKWETWNLAPKLTWTNSGDWVLVSWISVDHWNMRNINRLERINTYLRCFLIINLLFMTSAVVYIVKLIPVQASLFFYTSIFTHFFTCTDSNNNLVYSSECIWFKRRIFLPNKIAERGRRVNRLRSIYQSGAFRTNFYIRCCLKIYRFDSKASEPC